MDSGPADRFEAKFQRNLNSPMKSGYTWGTAVGRL
jgi:hypothetical protein